MRIMALAIGALLVASEAQAQWDYRFPNMAHASHSEGLKDYFIEVSCYESADWLWDDDWTTKDPPALQVFFGYPLAGRHPGGWRTAINASVDGVPLPSPYSSGMIEWTGGLPNATSNIIAGQANFFWPISVQDKIAAGNRLRVEVLDMGGRLLGATTFSLNGSRDALRMVHCDGGPR